MYPCWLTHFANSPQARKAEKSDGEREIWHLIQERKEKEMAKYVEERRMCIVMWLRQVEGAFSGRANQTFL